MSTGPQPQHLTPATKDRKCQRDHSPSAFLTLQRFTNASGAPPPARSARHSGSHIPTGPQPQRLPPVTTGHNCRRGPSPGAFSPSQLVTHAHGAPASGVHVSAGPQPQRLPSVTACHRCLRGPGPTPLRLSERGAGVRGAPAPARDAGQARVNVLEAVLGGDPGGVTRPAEGLRGAFHWRL